MAIYIIPKSLQRMWDEWNIRGAVLFSLCLQILLIFLAGMRKRTANPVLIAIIWLMYLSADWVAIFALGLIVNNQSSECPKGSLNNNVAAFWCSFLLLHLGGPDSITAFSNEDNQLWLRHLFGLLVEWCMALYVLLLAIPNPFWIPSVLVFLDGTIKYGERTVALYLASYINRKEPRSIGGLYQKIDSSDRKYISEEACGYNLYSFFMPQMMGGIDYHDKSRNIFYWVSKQDHKDAFNIMEVELNFMYDEIFTKMGMLHKKGLRVFNYLFRICCTALIAAAFLKFTFQKKHKAEIHTFDVYVTYTLCVGAVVLDIVSLFKLIFSDWTIGSVNNSKSLAKIIRAIRKRIIVFGRWREQIRQHNMISYCLQNSTCRTVKGRIFNKSPPDIKYHASIVEELQNIIFEYLKKKSDPAEIQKYLQRLDWATEGDEGKKYVGKMEKFKESLSLSGREYGSIIFTWHLATSFLYHAKGKDSSSSAQLGNPDRKICCILSNYLFYLLERRPTLLPGIRPALGKFLKIHHTMFAEYCTNKGITTEEKASEKLLKRLARDSQFNFEWKLVCELVEELGSMEAEDMWKMMKNVWLDLLLHGVANSTPTAHAIYLAKGGDFSTIIWLLMAHFGFINHQLSSV